MKVNSKELRQLRVNQMNANAAIEGFYPDAEDRILQQKYIDGLVSLGELLKHARIFSENAKNDSEGLNDSR